MEAHDDYPSIAPAPLGLRAVNLAFLAAGCHALRVMSGIAEYVTDQGRRTKLLGRSASKHAKKGGIGIKKSAVRRDAKDAVNGVFNKLLVTRFGERESLFSALAFRDFQDHHADREDHAADPAKRVETDQPGALRAGLSQRRALYLDVKNRFAPRKHAPQVKLDGLGNAWIHVARHHSRMFVCRQAVYLCKLLVYAQIPQVRAVDGQTNRCGAIDLIQLGKLFTGPCFTFGKRLVRPYIFVAETFLVQCAFQCRRKTHQMIFQYVIIHSLLDAFDGGFLA